MLKSTLPAVSLVVLGLLWGGPSRAEPDEACRTGAAQCRDAYEALDKCEHTPAKTEAKLPTPADAKASSAAILRGEPPPPASAAKPACTAERAAADAACKSTNTTCVREERQHPSRPRKG